jgi:SHS2 domain-containing protein
MPFVEIPHTADRCMRIWAADIPILFSEAARAMYALAGIKLAQAPRQTRNISLSAPDQEGLLVGFLTELLFLAEEENSAFNVIDLMITSREKFTLYGTLEGAKILSMSKLVKAVTFHRLSIINTHRGVETEITFDV